jgi:hypothetical protein
MWSLWQRQACCPRRRAEPDVAICCGEPFTDAICRTVAIALPKPPDPGNGPRRAPSVSERADRTCKRNGGVCFDAVIDPLNNGGPLCLITNNTGHPSLTIRVGFNDNGLPLGTTLIGRLFDEGTIVRLGMALETELGVWDKRPNL